MNSKYENKGIILFDGICNLCNSLINFIINRDNSDYFLFIPIQSEEAAELLSKYKIEERTMAGLILIENDLIYAKSTAALRISRKLNRLYPFLYVLIFVPRIFRDGLYNVVARNRYRLFGKKDSCNNTFATIVKEKTV
ncbi:MAG: DUF393 domain-containing protein [Bacteroidota bacterium]